jgi:hypothetical protein
MASISVELGHLIFCQNIMKRLFELKFKMTYLLTYLCGTTTNIWLRPVQEDLSMTACLEHSASNL